MAVRTRIRNPSQIVKAMRPRWEAAGFTNFQDRDTKLRAMAQPMVEELRIFSEENQQAFNDLQVGAAGEGALDSLGKSWGLPRIESRFAQVSSAESSLAFFVTSGVFGDINSSNPIVIPQTVTIWSDANENDQNEKVTYRLDSSVTLPADESLVFVSATCITDGPLGNVGAQVLRNHDFTNYTSSGAKSLKVINFSPILNGTAQESLERYRSRLLAYFRGLQSANYDAILFNSLGIPGVRTTSLARGYFGIGSGAVFVNGPEARSNSRMIAAVQQSIRNSTPPGGELQAIPMVEVTLDVNVKVKTTGVVSAARQDQIVSQLRSTLLGYIRDVLQSNYIDLSEFQRRATSVLASQGVTIPRDGFFDRIYLGRSYGGASSDERNLLIGTAAPLKANEYPALGTFNVVFE
jgi:hypothetical protein